jgi:hypothetical protein
MGKSSLLACFLLALPVELRQMFYDALAKVKFLANWQLKKVFSSQSCLGTEKPSQG